MLSQCSVLCSCVVVFKYIFANIIFFADLLANVRVATLRVSLRTTLHTSLHTPLQGLLHSILLWTRCSNSWLTYLKSCIRKRLPYYEPQSPVPFRDQDRLRRFESDRLAEYVTRYVAWYIAKHVTWRRRRLRRCL